MNKIKFDVRDSALGTEVITPCPFGEKGKYTHELMMVGGRACMLCQYFGGIDECFVKCKHK